MEQRTEELRTEALRTEPPPHEAIADALARIEAAYPALAFADERAADEAGQYIRQGLRAIRQQLRRARPAMAP